MGDYHVYNCNILMKLSLLSLLLFCLASRGVGNYHTYITVQNCKYFDEILSVTITSIVFLLVIEQMIIVFI